MLAFRLTYSRRAFTAGRARARLTCLGCAEETGNNGEIRQRPAHVYHRRCRRLHLSASRSYPSLFGSRRGVASSLSARAKLVAPRAPEAIGVRGAHRCNGIAAFRRVTRWNILFRVSSKLPPSFPGEQDVQTSRLPRCQCDWNGIHFPAENKHRRLRTAGRQRGLKPTFLYYEHRLLQTLTLNFKAKE
jgi:hypothetical protein